MTAKKDLPYYKIQYAFKSTWTLSEAAYLLMGYSPNNKNFIISENATNKVSSFYYWLHSQHLAAKLGDIGFAYKEPARFNVDCLLQHASSNGWLIDNQIISARNLFLGKELKTQAESQIAKIIYRKAAATIWKKYPDLCKPAVTKHLVCLPEHIRNKYDIKLRTYGESYISEFLKNDSPHGNGKPPKDKPQDLPVDWLYVIDKL